MSRTPAAAIGLGLAVLALAACASRGGTASRTARTTSPGGSVPAFSGLQRALQRGAVPREQGDVAALRRAGPAISQAGLALLQARMPHDLRRADVERFLDTRAAFGAALKLWVGALAAPDDAAVPGAYDGLVEAYWAWVDAYRGVSPERAV